ncbi:MAG: aminotransferase class V-fold PLP-dependent enzyme, partial [Candidatus Liptonbacteria bacterium]|nr:aminotransferase class V-fold PLP-dependent enzyme [Candidatus Liptonbacteria bacterium]
VDELGVDPVRGRSPQGGRSRAFSGAASNGVDLMTLSGHKIYGPKGVGVLYVKSKFQNPNIKQNPNSKIQMIKPIVTGGGQEFGLRSGTENVPLVVGFARAVELATKARAKEKDRILKLRDYFWEKLNAIVPEAERNGGEPALPNIVNVYFPRHRAEDMLVKLDLAGIAASSGSACRARSITPSHVILAMGYSEERAKRSVRFSFGRPTTRQDIDTTLTVIKNSFTK